MAIFGFRKLETDWAIVWRCVILCLAISYFDMIPWHATDRQTDGHTTIANTALA